MRRAIHAAGAVALAAAPAITGMTASTAAGATTAPSETPARETFCTCATEALSSAEIAAGAVNTIVCDDTPEGAAALSRLASQFGGGVAALGSTLLATHFSGQGASGSSLSVYGTACDGSGVNFAAGDTWNDRMYSTKHAACPNVKHWVDANFTGASQITQGAPGAPVNLNSTLAGQVSSVRYYGS